MTRNLTRLIAALAGLTACASQPATETGDFAMKVSALTGSCGSVSTNSPLGEIRKFKLIVREPDGKGGVLFTDNMGGRLMQQAPGGAAAAVATLEPGAADMEVVLDQFIYPTAVH